jgi:hypothetical protein
MVMFTENNNNNNRILYFNNNPISYFNNNNNNTNNKGTGFSSSLCVQTDSEAHSASYPMSTGGEVLSPWVKRGQGVT